MIKSNAKQYVRTGHFRRRKALPRGCYIWKRYNLSNIFVNCFGAEPEATRRQLRKNTKKKEPKLLWRYNKYCIKMNKSCRRPWTPTGWSFRTRGIALYCSSREGRPRVTGSRWWTSCWRWSGRTEWRQPRCCPSLLTLAFQPWPAPRLLWFRFCRPASLGVELVQVTVRGGASGVRSVGVERIHRRVTPRVRIATVCSRCSKYNNNYTSFFIYCNALLLISFEILYNY